MIQIVTNNNDCSTCTHSNVCAYKSVFENARQKVRNNKELKDININSPISCEVKCNEYKPELIGAIINNDVRSAADDDIALCKDMIISNDTPFPKVPKLEVCKETFGLL